MYWQKKEYKIRHYVILVAVFYVVTYIFKFSLSHFILEAIHPEAVALCKEGFLDRGIDLSPMMAYIKEFGSAAWAKKIPFARNYFNICSFNSINYSIPDYLKELRQHQHYLLFFHWTKHKTFQLVNQLPLKQILKIWKIIWMVLLCLLEMVYIMKVKRIKILLFLIHVMIIMIF